MQYARVHVRSAYHEIASTDCQALAARQVFLFCTRIRADINAPTMTGANTKVVVLPIIKHYWLWYAWSSTAGKAAARPNWRAGDNVAERAKLLRELLAFKVGCRGRKSNFEEEELDEL